MKIMGHRGARHEAPENTLASIERALAAGAEGIEIDVHFSRCGRLVVIHDETLDRTTNGNGPVGALDLAELQALDAGEGQQIPTLDEVLLAVGDRAELFVELKAPGCEEAVVAAIRNRGRIESSYVISFVHPWLQTVGKLEPALRTGCLIYGRPADPAGLLRAAGASVLSMGIALVDGRLVEQCHEAGLQVCVWNCNEPSEVAGYAALGVDWLGTDVPTAVCALA
ncbi:MAG: glycerophosphodiester phosphodiesterase [Planctomycetes bacterium]|nr:glycerophosphodiester phosphodiesterase [Planctomycetota bacterium]